LKIKSKISKELVIYLSSYEKKSLLRFLLIYLISIYSFILVLAYMFYTIEIKNLHESYGLKIRSFASHIAHQIITSHMMDDEMLSLCLKEKSTNECFKNSENYKISLYGMGEKPLHVGFFDEVDFTQNFYFKDDNLFYIDESSQLHLGVKYVVVKKEGVSHERETLTKEALLYALLGLIFATLLGYVLAKLFLKPIKAEIETLDNFIKDSTHELNTPITAILMSIETLKDIDPKKKKRIELSGKRIASLYGNMSYMLLHDKQSELKQEVELKALIEERMEYFSDLAQSKGLHISLALSEKSLHVNEESMIKLIDNLLSNAIKYNDINGSIEIMLTQEFLSVKDSGVGIPQSKIKEITKRYKRANSDKGGFGIGLDIVSTICKTNGFRLEISSQEGEGSTFSIFF